MARQFGGLRTARGKSTAAASAVVAVSLAIAGLAVAALQRKALVDAIDTALLARVDDLSALILDGAVPATLTVPGDDDALVQIVDANGSVIASSRNIDGEARITNVTPPAGRQVVGDTVLPIGEDQFRLVARTVGTGERAYTVYAASSLGPVTEAIGALGAILITGIPMLTLLVSAAVWFIVGRTLRPVEAIRTEVEAIGDRQLDRRVPVPDTDDEIGRLASTMNDMLDRIEQASVQQRQFVADASHELRSPLAAIRSQLEVDLVHPETVDWRAPNPGVLDETLRMQRLVDDLLLLARSDSGTLPVRRRMVDFDDVVLAEVARLSAGAIAVDASHVSGAQVQGDEMALGRAVGNLLENATRYAASRVAVDVTEGEGAVHLVIDDDGPGIPTSDRERVFDRFTRLDEARDRDHGGSGLGLAIAKEIIDHHRGSIMIEISPLGGTRVVVDLPSAATG